MRPRTLFCALIAGAALPAMALADGGNTIAGAPVVSPGVVESGDTANVGSIASNTLGCHSWWRVPVIKDDHLSITFHGSDSMMAELYPIGTNDSNFVGTNPVADLRGSEQADANSDGAGDANYVVGHTGTMLLSFSAPSCGGSSTVTGPYDFTVTDLHGLMLSAGRKTDAATHTTTVYLAAHTGTGEAVGTPLQVQLERPEGGRWFVVDTETAPAHFTIRWKHPTWGRVEHIRMIVSGSGYVTSTKRVKIRVP